VLEFLQNRSGAPAPTAALLLATLANNLGESIWDGRPDGF
jgi:hypothetical protein